MLQPGKVQAALSQLDAALKAVTDRLDWIAAATLAQLGGDYQTLASYNAHALPWVHTEAIPSSTAVVFNFVKSTLNRAALNPSLINRGGVTVWVQQARAAQDGSIAADTANATEQFPLAPGQVYEPRGMVDGFIVTGDASGASKAQVIGP